MNKMNKKQEKVINAFDKFVPGYIADSYHTNKFLSCYLKAKRECKLTQNPAEDIMAELEEAFDKVAMETPDYFTVKAMFIKAREEFLKDFQITN